MSSSLTAPRGATTVLTVLAAVALFIFGFAGSAQAADKTSGKVNFNITSGKAGKVSAVKPAKVAKRFGKKGAKVRTNARNGQFAGKARAGLKAAGGIRFASGKRRVVIRGLEVSVFAKRTVVRGKLRGKKIKVFNVAGKANINSASRTAKLNRSKLSLTNRAAKQIRRALKLRKAPRGKLGTLALNLKVTSTTPVDPCDVNPDAEECQEPLVDPYLAQCGVEAVVKVPGTITPAGPLPEFTNQTGTTGPADLAWGFKSSYRNYVVNLAGGSIHVADGASTTGTAPTYSGFEFPASGFRYTDNGTPADLTDDKAVLEGTGTALFCNQPHGFRVAISNPTVVIDGANSRIDADVDSNLSGNWIPTQRVTIADIDVSKVSRTNGETGSIEKWTDAPATLTAEGSQAVCGKGDLDKCSTFYPAGTELDPVTLEVSLSDQLTGVEDQYNTECGVPVAGISNNSWVDASAMPTLTSPVPATSPAGIQWGFLESFRGYVYGVMAGNMPPPDLSAKAIQALDGASRYPTTPPGSFNPTRGFMFPVADGGYAANTAATNDDQAVLNGSGTALFCNVKHGFWVSISNPTIVIDGDNSRIVADLSQNTYGPQGTEPWQTTQRVDLADLDLSGVTPTYGTGTVEWADVPVTLSEEASPFATYTSLDPEEGPKALDPITISLETE